MRNTEKVSKSHNRSDVLKTLNLYNSSKKGKIKKWQPEYSTFDAFSNSAASSYGSFQKLPCLHKMGLFLNRIEASD